MNIIQKQNFMFEQQLEKDREATKALRMEISIKKKS